MAPSRSSAGRTRSASSARTSPTARLELDGQIADDLGVSIVHITHDLATVYYISDRIIIMQRGRVVEAVDARTVLSAPQHPYSRLLRDSVLSPDTAGTNQLDSRPGDGPPLS